MPENKYVLNPEILKKFSPEIGAALEKVLSELPPENAAAYVEALSGLTLEQASSFEQTIYDSLDEQGERPSTMMERRVWHLESPNYFPEGMPFVSWRTYIAYYVEQFNPKDPLRGSQATWLFGDTYAVDWLRPIILDAEEDLDRLTTGRRFARLTTDIDSLVGRDPDTWWHGDETNVNCDHSVYMLFFGKGAGRRVKYPYKASFQADGQRPNWGTTGKLSFFRNGILGRLDLQYLRSGSGYKAVFEFRDGALVPVRLQRNASRTDSRWVTMWATD